MRKRNLFLPSERAKERKRKGRQLIVVSPNNRMMLFRVFLHCLLQSNTVSRIPPPHYLASKMEEDSRNFNFSNKYLLHFSLGKVQICNNSGIYWQKVALIQTFNVYTLYIYTCIYWIYIHFFQIRNRSFCPFSVNHI